MRILFVIDHLSSGGAQGQLALLASHLQQRGHTIEVFVYYQHRFRRKDLIDTGVTIHEAVQGSANRARRLGRLRKLISSTPFDVVVSFLTGPNLLSITAKRLTRSRARLVVSERSSERNPNHAMRWHVANRLYRLADRLVVNSFHLKTYYRTVLGWPDSRVETIWNGVDLRKFRVAQAGARHPTTPRVICAGAISPQKNAEVIIRALSILRRTTNVRPTVNWIARRYPRLLPAEQAEFARLNHLLVELGVADQWNWTEETDNIAARYQEHELMIHASIVEGLPNVICEALSSGLPVIAGDLLDHPRLIEHGVTGRLFAPDSAEQLAGWINEWAGLTVEEKNRRSSAARKFAERELDAHRMVDRWESLLMRVVESGAGSARID